MATYNFLWVIIYNFLWWNQVNRSPYEYMYLYVIPAKYMFIGLCIINSTTMLFTKHVAEISGDWIDLLYFVTCQKNSYFAYYGCIIHEPISSLGEYAWHITDSRQWKRQTSHAINNYDNIRKNTTFLFGAEKSIFLFYIYFFFKSDIHVYINI